nr:transcription factor MYB44-like [Ipomoea batatas]
MSTDEGNDLADRLQHQPLKRMVSVGVAVTLLCLHFNLGSLFGSGVSESSLPVMSPSHVFKLIARTCEVLPPPLFSSAMHTPPLPPPLPVSFQQPLEKFDLGGGAPPLMACPIPPKEAVLAPASA